MVRGTTALHTFTFPQNIEDNYANIIVTYRQNGKTVLEKYLSDLDIDDCVASIRLTQEETLSFDEGKAFVQLKVFTNQENVLNSPIFNMPVNPTLSNYVITDGSIPDTMESFDLNNFENKISIITGTTPSFYFIPQGVQVSSITQAFLIIKQCGKTVIEKSLESADISDGVMLWTLSQEETFKLKPFIKAMINCVWKLEDGFRGESVPRICSVYRSSKPEII